MNLLLDTHVLLWWLADDASLSEHARNAIIENNNIVFVSAATIWEIVIKKGLGKLRIPGNLQDALRENYFQSLPVTARHALGVGKLPRIHQDPFDRMLIAQTKEEKLTLITRDQEIQKYRIPFIAA